jgi:hypothetical protein
MLKLSIRLGAAAALLAALPAMAAEQISVVERPVNETTVHRSGDRDTVDKVEVGSDQGYCVRTVAGKSWECFWTLLLKAGQITVEGPFMDSGDSLLVVTGGTGKYAGARGSLKLHPRDATPTGYDFIYDLL